MNWTETDTEEFRKELLARKLAGGDTSERGMRVWASRTLKKAVPQHDSSWVRIQRIWLERAHKAASLGIRVI